jgi:DNA invertase Pin-like site-specific DNA recombinase
MVIVPAAPAAPLRALLYDRVSTVTQAKSGYSGGADGFQLDRCRAYATSHAWDIVGTLTDTDSGAKWEIAGIMEALDRAKRREYDVLIVSDTSRFARSLAKKVVYEGELERYGVTVHYTNLPNLPSDDTPEARLTKNIMGGVYGALDEYDRDKRTWWTTQGRLKKAQRGLVVGAGPAPYGYRYVTEWVEERKRDVPIGLERDAETAAIVERIFRDIFELSASDLADALMDDKIVPPASWTPTAARPRSGRWAMTTIRRMVHNPVYRGEWLFGEIRVPVPALVDDATWQQAQQVLVARRRTRRGRNTDRSALWTLRGALTCGHCGGSLSTSSVGITGVGGVAWPDRRMRRYVCARSVPFEARRNGWELCKLPGLLAADDRTIKDGPRRYPLAGLEELAWEAVWALAYDADLLREKLDGLRDEHAGAREERARRVGDLDAEIATHERRLRRAAEEKLAVEVDDERYAIYHDAERRASETVKRLKREREQLVALPSPGLTDDEERELAQWFAKLRAGLEHADPTERRRTYQLLQLRGRVRHDPEGGTRVGRSALVSVEWETVIGSGQSLKKLCLLRNSAGLRFVRLERGAAA